MELSQWRLDRIPISKYNSDLIPAVIMQAKQCIIPFFRSTIHSQSMYYPNDGCLARRSDTMPQGFMSWHWVRQPPATKSILWDLRERIVEWKEKPTEKLVWVITIVEFKCNSGKNRNHDYEKPGVCVWSGRKSTTLNLLRLPAPHVTTNHSSPRACIVCKIVILVLAVRLAGLRSIP